MPRTVIAENLREGSLIVVHGKLSFSRLAHPIEGKALEASIDRQRKLGRKYPTLSPHTTVTLSEAQVLPNDPSGQMTPEEIFVYESFYTAKSGAVTFSVDNVGTSLPPVLAKGDDGQYRQVELEGDLDTGLDVMVVLNVFKPKQYEKRGLGISQVFVNEPLRYYASTGIPRSLLERHGIVVSGEVRVPAPAASSADTAPENGDVDAPSGTVVENGVALPGPGLVPSAPVAAQPAPVTQVTPTTPVATAAAPAPATQVSTTAPFPPAAPVQAPAAAQAPVAPAQPVAAPAPGAQPGETQEQYLMRLQSELNALRTAQNAAGAGASPFDPAPAAAPAAAPDNSGSNDPWGQTSGIVYTG